jgi:DNA-binding GntR family transcriptional regulator
MTGSATVSPLAAPSRAESVVAELVDAICMGELLPGHEVSLTELAEQYQLRPVWLKQRLRGLADSGLFTVVGDTVVVARLDADELRAMHRFHAAIRDDLFAESCELIAPAELNRLEALIPDVAIPRGLDGPATYRALMYTFGSALIELQQGLCAPAASPWELRVFHEIQRASRRYYGLGWAIVYGAGREPSGAAVRSQQRMLDRWREIIDCVRAGNQAGARELLRRDADQSEWIGEHSLISDYGSVGTPFAGQWASRAESSASVAGDTESRPKLQLIQGGLAPARTVS